MEKLANNFNKRIAIFGTFLSWSGYYKAPCEDLAERLEARKWKVVRSSERLSKAGRLIDMIVTAWKKRDAYSVGAVEVYSGQAFLWAEAVCLILNFIRKPYVLTLHGGSLPEFSKKWPLRVKMLIKSATRVTTPSRYLYEKMRPFRDDLVLIPNPINMVAYPFRLRRKVSPNLIWLRKFRDIYNPSLLPKVVDLLAKRDVDVHLEMIGPDSGDGSLKMTKDLAKNLSIMDRIDFTGGVPKENVPANLERHDIFINTTNIDNTPISVIEAMACGLCIVSTNVGGIPYLLDHGRDALLVPPNDPQAMADSVHRIVAEPDLAEQLSRNAQVKAQRFSWDLILPMWEDLLEDTITG